MERSLLSSQGSATIRASTILLDTLIFSIRSDQSIGSYYKRYRNYLIVIPEKRHAFRWRDKLRSLKREFEELISLAREAIKIRASVGSDFNRRRSNMLERGKVRSREKQTTIEGSPRAMSGGPFRFAVGD